MSHRRPIFALFAMLILLLPALVACGGGGGGATATTAAGGTTAPSGGTPAATTSPSGTAPVATASPSGSPAGTPGAVATIPPGTPGAGVKVTIGSKLDVDGQLNAQMYALLLESKGFDVTTKLGLGQTPVLDAAVKNGSIDIYPEFTGTALALLHLPATQDAQKAYNDVKSAYQQQFQLTWLAPAYGLNDSYAICTSQEVAQQNNLKTLDDLAPVAGQMTLASQQDGIEAAVNPVQDAYGYKFGKVVQISEQLSFDAVKKGDADLNVCYTTDPHIVTDNFVVLQDTKNVFPIYNPAPVVRDELLQRAPSIQPTLDALQPHLTTEVMLGLIKQVSVDHKSVEDVARTFLQQQGLLGS